LLTGGDPLVLTTNKLENIIRQLREIEHVEIVRIGTKVPAFNPSRILDDPGFIAWTEVDLTFTNLTASVEGDSWSLGEGEWSIAVGEGGADIDIISMTVGYEGSAYKLEDTNIQVMNSDMVPTALAAEPLGPPPPTSRTTITIMGIDYKAGVFYHPGLGKIWFRGTIVEDSPPDAITGNSLEFSGDAGQVLFNVYFDYDYSSNIYAPETYYNIFMSTVMYSERGYIVEGEFIQSDLAPWIP